MWDFQKPEVTTVIRWCLRVILVVFLAWLVRQRPDQEEEEETDERQNETRRPSVARARNNASNRTIARLQPRRDPYPPAMRQRRFGQTGESVDFDAVINKVSKPKEMWEVRKSGEGPPQIFRRQDSMHPDGEEWDNGPGSFAKPSESSTPKGSVAGGGSNSGASSAKQVARDTIKGKESTLHGHERPVTFITWNYDCNLLFTCGKDKIVRVWSCPDGECLGSYMGHQGAVWACSVTSDSRWLVTSGADRLVIVWEARTSRELSRVELPGVVRFVEWAGGSSSPACTPDNERFVTCHNRFGVNPATITIWLFDGTAIEERLKIAQLPTPATQVRWGHADDFVVSAHENGEIIFWRADTGALVRKIQAHDVAISKFDFSSDRELIATASPDMSVRIWDLGKGSEGKKIYTAETDRPLNAVAVGPLTRSVAIGTPTQRPKNCTIIAAGGQDARDVTMCSSTTEQFGTMLFQLGADEAFPSKLHANGMTKGHFGPVHTLAFARDGSAIASGSEDGCVRLHIFDTSLPCSDSKEEALEKDG